MKWISVKDQSPSTDFQKRYLVYIEDTDRIEVSKWCRDYSLEHHKVIWFWDYEDRGDIVTHWMHLPKPPRAHTTNGESAEDNT